MTVFGDWLMGELRKREWGQSELARRSGVSQTEISRLVSGQRNPGGPTAIAIAKALGYNPETVLRLTGILPASPKASHVPLGLEELVSISRELGDDELGDLLAFARHLQNRAEGKRARKPIAAHKPREVS